MFLARKDQGRKVQTLALLGKKEPRPLVSGCWPLKVQIKWYTAFSLPQLRFTGA